MDSPRAMRRGRARGVLGALVLSVLGGVALAAPDSSALLLAVRGLQISAKNEDTSYRHTDQVVEWTEDGHGTRVHADCSGLVNAVLKRVCEIDGPKLAMWLGRVRPLARDYHDTIVAERGFTRVKSVTSIRPMDLIAIKFEAGAKDTGHVMFADSGAFKREASAPIVEGTTQWEVQVIDSAASPHGVRDTRYKEGGPSRAGVGRGSVRLYADDDGTIVGYTWSTGRGSVYRSIKDRPLAVGRLNVMEKKPWEAGGAAAAPEESRGDGTGEAAE